MDMEVVAPIVVFACLVGVIVFVLSGRRQAKKYRIASIVAEIKRRECDRKGLLRKLRKAEKKAYAETEGLKRYEDTTLDMDRESYERYADSFYERKWASVSLVESAIERCDEARFRLMNELGELEQDRNMFSDGAIGDDLTICFWVGLILLGTSAFITAPFV